MSERIVDRFVKGCIAGLIVRKALDEGCNIDDAQRLVVDQLKDELPRYSLKITASAISADVWPEMWAVAHFWAVLLGIMKPEDRRAGPSFLPLSHFAGDSLGGFLLASERTLDQMRARPDLAHPDPLRCSPEMRAHLEATEVASGG